MLKVRWHRRGALFSSSMIAAMLLLVCGWSAPVGSAASTAEPTAKLPCVFYNTRLGEYGEFVFRPLYRPGRCTEYVGNKPCHCTESPLSGVHWRHWGDDRSVGVGDWHYCGMDVCFYRRAYLIAYRLRSTCGPVYTRLRMRLPRQKLPGRPPFHVFRTVFHLPACGGPFETE